MMRRESAFLLFCLALIAVPASGQDRSELFPVQLIEQRLRHEPLAVLDVHGGPKADDRRQRVMLEYAGDRMLATWIAVSPVSDAARYELAAYELQKLFLTEGEHVVPVTVMRAVPSDWFARYDSLARPSFEGTGSVVLILRYWLAHVSADDIYSRDRFEQDSMYARYFANFNIFTHLTRHGGSRGSFLISADPASPRVVALENSQSFHSDPLPDAAIWHVLRIDRLPRATVERLRSLTPADLQNRLGVLTQFDERGAQLVLAAPAANLNEATGVRRVNQTIQIGLTRREIDAVHLRLRQLLERVDRGSITLF